MTSHERLLRAIRHQPPDRIPVSLRFCPEKWAEIKAALRMDEQAAWAHLGQDVVTVRPRYKKEAAPIHYADPTAYIDENGYYCDIYGVPFRKMEAAGQAYLELSGKVVLRGADDPKELDRFLWPSTEDWDYSMLRSRLLEQSDKATWARGRGCMGIAQFMRGMEGFFFDMVDDPQYTKELLDRIYAFVREDMRKTLEAGAGGYTFVEYNDDIATQRGMMLSPRQVRTFVLPYLHDFCQLAHAHGAFVRYHSCGAISEVIDDLIDVGIDILDPVQPLATGMDPIALLHKYKGKLCLHGGLDIQRLLPHGSIKEVRAYVERLAEAGKDGGFILAGSHTIQIDAQVGNILAAVDEVMGR